MKDKKARKMIHRLADNIGICVEFEGENQQYDVSNFLWRAEKLLEELENISIKDCPKCKHPVLAKARPVDYLGITIYGFGKAEIPPLEFRCLTCGVKFICNNRCICEVVDEK